MIARLWCKLQLFSGLLLVLLVYQSPLAIGQEVVSTDRGSVFTSGKLRFKFADVEQGREILRADDDFMTRLSTFDLQSRVRTTDQVSFQVYKTFVDGHVVAWDDQQVDVVKRALSACSDSLASIAVPNLPVVQFIKTSGREESGAAYTRSNAIILTQQQLSGSQASLEKLILHELFHVISRANPELRDQLYKILGFTRSSEIRLPETLRDRRITNPDAPITQHVLKVNLADEKEVFVAPVLFANSEYDPQKVRSMFGYLTFKLMQVEKAEDGNWHASLNAEQPVMHDPSLADFQRQIGRNTGYIIHPEEILADNFAELMQNNFDLPDTWILDKMKLLLLK